MNGVTTGIVAGIIILAAAVIGVVSYNTWNTNQQTTSQTYAGDQVKNAT